MGTFLKATKGQKLTYGKISSQYAGKTSHIHWFRHSFKTPSISI